MAESKYLNHVEPDHQVQSRELIPSDYHCTCEYCRNFMGEIFNNDEQKNYSNRIRRSYYADEAGDHLDAGHIIGYRWAIQNLCPEGGVVLDPTVGTGTAIIEAINNGRNGIGIELEYPEVAEKNIEAQKETQVKDTWTHFRQGNAVKIDEYMKEWGFEEEKAVDLIINGTPYPKISGRSSDAPERKNLKTGEDKSFDYNHEENIGITKGEAYDNLVRIMYTKSIKYLKPGGYFVILIKDMVQNKEPYLLHKHIIDIVLDNNPEMEQYGFFLHSHAPTTMFQNTYGKRFPEVPIPWYQAGIVLRKKLGLKEGFKRDFSGHIRQVPYKLHASDSEYTVDYRTRPGKVIWKHDEVECARPIIETAAKPVKKPKKENKTGREKMEKITDKIYHEDFRYDASVRLQFDKNSPENLKNIKLEYAPDYKSDVVMTEAIELDLLLKPGDFINTSEMEFDDLSDEQYRVYEFEKKEIRIDNPLKLNVSESGGHRVWDARGISHYIPSGWLHLYFLVKKGESHFAF